MFYLLGFLEAYEVPREFLDVPIRIAPVDNKEVYLRLSPSGMSLSPSSDSVTRLKKKGKKKYKMISMGTKVCHKKASPDIGDCKKGGNKSKTWNIKKGDGGYTIKSNKKRFLGFLQACLTYDDGRTIKIKRCRSGRRNQLFDLLPVDTQSEVPEEDEEKPDEKPEKKEKGQLPCSDEENKGESDQGSDEDGGGDDDEDEDDDDENQDPQVPESGFTGTPPSSSPGATGTPSSSNPGATGVPPVCYPGVYGNPGGQNYSYGYDNSYPFYAYTISFANNAGSYNNPNSGYYNYGQQPYAAMC